jgi:hypothetical protein
MKRLFFLFLLIFATKAQAELVREGGSTLSLIGIGAGAIDTVGGFTYFIDTGTLDFLTFPTIQVTHFDQVRITDLGESGSKTVISTFSTVASQIQNTALIDTQGQFAYFTFGQSTTTLAKFALPGFTTMVSSVALSSTLGHPTCEVLDPTTSYAYYGTDTSPGQILKIDLTNLTIVSSITLPSPNTNILSAVIDTQNHFAYFGSGTTPGNGNVAKINLANFSYVNTLTFNNAGAARSGFLNTTQGFLWFGTNDSPGKVVQIQLSNFQVRNTLTLSANENELASVIYDPVNQYAYFGTDTSTGIVVQVQPVAMKRIESLELNSGEAFLETALMDADHYGYFATLTNPGRVVKLDLIGGVAQITSIAPPEEEVPVGQPASFSVSATGRNLSYQWNRDGTPIVGATQTSYQLSPTTLTDDGVTFTCSVINSSGTVTSGGTVLTVDPDIHVFPDPWRADRHNGLPLSFNGLPSGCLVEIFTLAAQWVATIPENGGVATWNLKNNSGQNAASGYYFYYVKTTDDRHTLRGKFALIR